MRFLLFAFAAGLIGAVMVGCNVAREHLPWTSLVLEERIGAAAGLKLAALRDKPAECASILSASALEFTTIDISSEADECALAGAVHFDRSNIPYNDAVRVSCPLAAAIYLWERDVVTPAAAEHLGAEVTRIDHAGAYACRRLYGRNAGDYSEHARGLAIDIAGFRLSDGRRIGVLEHWDENTPEGAFLHQVRDESCDLFQAVLSPDYNSAHADHLHLDMGPHDICD